MKEECQLFLKKVLNLTSRPTACCLLHATFLLGWRFNPDDGEMFLLNVSRHAIISQKTEIFI
jgi:hypothetical protein